MGCVDYRDDHLKQSKVWPSFVVVAVLELSSSFIEGGGGMASLTLLIIKLRIVFCCGGLHSGGATPHLHTATLIQKSPADLGHGVGQHHGGETATQASEPNTYGVQGGVTHVDTLKATAFP